MNVSTLQFNRWTGCRSLLGIVLAFSVSVVITPSRADEPFDAEITFASRLVRLGFPDLAEQIVSHVLRQHPRAAPHAAFVRIEILTARGRFDEAREVIAAMPADSLETLSMQLALGDAYYAWNRITEARAVYDDFFKRFPDGPPDTLTEFYRESAYRYAQMLMHAGDEESALKAFGYILLSEPDRQIKRRIQTEMADLAVKLGSRADGEQREAHFEYARQLAHDLQWGGLDLWFGKSVVILSHIEVINDNIDQARSIIREYLPMLRQIDDALRAEAAPMRFSPMAECRYLLGMLHLREAEALQAAEQPDDAIAQYADALRHLHNVFIQYPGSAWAMEAGNTARRIVETLEGMGRRVRIPPFDMGPVIEAQLQEARLLLDRNDFEAAEGAYRGILTMFPETPTTVPVLADLARCYIELDDPIYAQVVIGYLAERFYANPDLRELAGTALLRVAGVYETASRPDAMRSVYDLYFRYYPDHPRAATVMLRQGENAFREGAYAAAIDHYSALIETHPDSREALDAMSRIAYCHTELDQADQAIPMLQAYREALPRGPRVIRAIYRLADAYRATGAYTDALARYAELIEHLADDRQARHYAHSAEDIVQNRAIYEQALFWRAYSASRLQEPADQQPHHLQAAIDNYRTFLDAFPRSRLAPAALSMQGTLFLLLNQATEAAAVFDRLAREFPDSEQARNAVFAQGSSLIELGQMQRAITVFEQMFERPTRFSPAQFLRVARVMIDEDQLETAVRALDVALDATDDRAVWENSAMAKSAVLLDLQRYDDAATLLETLLERYPQSAHSIEAGFQLSKAYAHQAAGMVNGAPRQATFQRAIRALRSARRRMQTPGERARADYELASLQQMMGQPGDATASYLRLFLLGNAGDPTVRPLIEKAYEAVIPLLLDAQQHGEIFDVSQVYLRVFPDGRRVDAARRHRDQARLQMARAGTAPVETGNDEMDALPDFQPLPQENGPADASDPANRTPEDS